MTTNTSTSDQGARRSGSDPRRTSLITGSSRGFGLALVQAALASDDRLVATARQPRQLAALLKRYAQAVAMIEHAAEIRAAETRAWATSSAQADSVPLVGTVR